MTMFSWTKDDANFEIEAYCSRDDLAAYNTENSSFRLARGLRRRTGSDRWMTNVAWKWSFPYPFDEAAMGIAPPRPLKEAGPVKIRESPIDQWFCDIDTHNGSVANYEGSLGQAYDIWRWMNTVRKPWKNLTMKKAELIARDMGWKIQV